MENILFALKSISACWLSSSPTCWTIKTAFALLCGLWLLLLLLPRFQTGPSSSPPRRRHRTSRKQQAELRRRSTRDKKKSEIVRACRDCLQELDGVRDLVSLLQSHLGRRSDQGGLPQPLGQEGPGDTCNAAPAGAQQPCGEPVTDAAPATTPLDSPTPTQHPPRLASILPAEPQEDRSNLKRTPRDTVTKSSPPDVQKLLEILITKSAELKIWKEKEKDGSVVKELCSDSPLNFWGPLWKSLGAEQDTTTPRSLWNGKDTLEKLPGPQLLPFPEVLEDSLQQKCSQLFWGLPSLHSESLVATALVSSSQLQVPSVLFNSIANCLPILIRHQVSSQFPSAPPCRGIQPQPSPPTVSQPQAHLVPSVPTRPPSLPPQTRTCGGSGPPSQKKTPPSVPTGIRHLEQPLLQKQPERERTLPSALRFPTFFSHVPARLPPNNQASESVSVVHGDFVTFNIQKQNPQRRLSEDKDQGRLSHRIQASLDLNSPRGECPGISQAQDKQGLSGSFVSKSKSSQTAQRARARCPRSSLRKGEARSQLENSFGTGPWQDLKRIPAELSRAAASFPEKVPGANSEKDLERYLMRTLKSGSGKHLARRPNKKHLEKTLKAHLHTKWGQISEGLIPVSVRRSWLVASHVLPEYRTHTEVRNLAPSKGRKACVNTSRELAFLNSPTRQMLETHIIRFRVKQRWALTLQAFQTLNLKPREAQPLPLPQSPSPCSATCGSGAHSKAKFYTFLGKPPEPYPGEKGITGESVPTSGSSLPAPAPPAEGVQKALEGTSPDDSHEPSEAPSSGWEGRSPSLTFTLSLINRTPQSETVMGARKGHLEPSLSSEIARNELTGKGGAQASQDKVARLEVKFRSQASRAAGAGEATEAEKAAAWKVILRPSMLPDSQAIYVDLRRSGSPGTRKSPSPPTELGAQEPKEPSLKTKITRKLELQEKAESEEPSQGCASGIPLRDSPCDLVRQDFAPGFLVQDRDTSVLLQDSHADVLLAEDILRSPFGSQSQCASRDTPPSPVPGGEPIAGRPSSRGQQEPSTPTADEPGKSQGKLTAFTDEREDPKGPKLEENEKGFAARRASQASGLSHPPQLRRTGDSLGNKYLHLMPEKGHIFPESHFRKRMRHFLHCLPDNKKCKGQEDPLQKGKPAPATVQGRGAVRGSLVMDGRAAEAQTVVTALRHILVEKLGPPQELHASETNQHKEFQGPGGGRCCCHGVLAHPDQRGVMRETASSHQATPKAHSCPNESQQTRDGGGRWVFPPREPGSPGRPHLHKPMAAGASGHVHHHPACSPQKCVSCHQAVGASHVFPDRRAFLQEIIEHTQRKPVSSV